LAVEACLTRPGDGDVLPFPCGNVTTRCPRCACHDYIEHQVGNVTGVFSQFDGGDGGREQRGSDLTAI